jgi:hypothetical protein
VLAAIASACSGDEEPPTVTRLTIATSSGVPGAHEPPPVTLSEGPRFRRAVGLLPRPLPSPIGVSILGIAAIESRTCFPVRLNVELSDGTTVSYAECGFPRSVLRACASLSALLPAGSGCPDAHPEPAVRIDPAVRPQSRPAAIRRVIRARLGDGTRIELMAALPTDVAACAFVGGCPPLPAGGRPRPAWLAIAYRAEGVIAPPTYLVVEDATRKVIASRTPARGG